ncbi:MAG: heavy metal-binding domain-containing protein, partial [Chitinophagaceae bacterium]
KNLGCKIRSTLKQKHCHGEGNRKTMLILTVKYKLCRPSINTGSNQLEGYRITKHLGIVRGITVRSRNIFGKIGAGLQSLVGGKISIYVELCEKTRLEALNTLFNMPMRKALMLLLMCAMMLMRFRKVSRKFYVMALRCKWRMCDGKN